MLERTWKHTFYFPPVFVLNEFSFFDYSKFFQFGCSSGVKEPTVFFLLASEEEEGGLLAPLL